jgi:serine/threonine protein kinase
MSLPTLRCHQRSPCPTGHQDLHNIWIKFSIAGHNVLLEADRKIAKLCDFGLVFFVDGERVTATMEQAGSRYYIAPECEDGRAESITPATDLYSFGKLVYYIASGGKMFARERHREPDRELAKVLVNPFAEHLSVLLDSLIVASPSGRVQSAADAADMIRATRRRLSISAPVRGNPNTHTCVFCHEGTYKVIAISQDGTAAHNLGYSGEGNVGGGHFIFVECDKCGNAQRFKFDRGADWLATVDPKKPGDRRVRSKNLHLTIDGQR